MLENHMLENHMLENHTELLKRVSEKIEVIFYK